eukprot:3554810-Alexandrium_andersonii.AAC.1
MKAILENKAFREADQSLRQCYPKAQTCKWSKRTSYQARPKELRPDMVKALSKALPSAEHFTEQLDNIKPGDSECPYSE